MRDQQPPPATRVRLLRRAGVALKRLGYSPAELIETELLEIATRTTGLSDFGDDSFRTPFRMLVTSTHGTNLGLPGRLGLRSECIRLLTNRLRMQDFLTRHPAVFNERIVRPLVIVGLPRTGTSLLQQLLAQDPGARVPYAWELRHPVPRSVDVSDAGRMRETDRAVRRLLRLAPALRAHHPYDPRGPEECNFLLEHAFQSFSFSLTFDLPPFHEWLLSADWTPAYRYLRTQLQLLQWLRPGRPWILKCPSHLYCLDALLETFPDACLVRTHRDLHKVVPSFASMATALRAVTGERTPDPRQIGEAALSMLGSFADGALRVSDLVDPSQVVDLSYAELTADPAAVASRVYGQFGFQSTSRMRGRMNQWLFEHPPDRFGAHRYSLDQFGLDGLAVDERFADYRERFAQWITS